ncbi:MAG: tetratricopeptide repeat protein, partial [Proteobacteria bacterium]|nr:tetratricopeptide repeat protein [Pseudomonadota bacterium]
MHTIEKIDKLIRRGEALAAYDRALELDPSNAVTWSNKGTALYALRRYNEAADALRASL